MRVIVARDLRYLMASHMTKIMTNFMSGSRTQPSPLWLVYMIIMFGNFHHSRAQGRTFLIVVQYIWALLVWGGGGSIKCLPGWFGALIRRRSAPECPVEWGGRVQSLFERCPNVLIDVRKGSSLTSNYISCRKSLSFHYHPATQCN